MSWIYLDWAATAPPDPGILEQVREISARVYGNPSAVHAAGREALGVLEDCRRRLAAVLGSSADEVVFTSGGTESNNMVLFTLLHRKSLRRIVASAVEHASVYQPTRTLERLGFQVSLVPAGTDGRVDPQRLLAAVDDHTAMVALMLVNNETGALQPVSEVAAGLTELARRRGRKVHLHCDAVQAFGKVPFLPVSLGVDSASLSGHKLGAPRGVGALFVRSGSGTSGGADFLYAGGEQEHGRRPGTENLPGIIGLVIAAEKAARHMEENLGRARQVAQVLLEGALEIPGAVAVPTSRPASGPEAFSPYIVNLSFPPVPGEVLVRALEEEGYLISTGSACSSRKRSRFRVLEGMGLNRALAFSAVRVSIGPGTKQTELQGLVAALRRRVPQLAAAAGA
jgi:cysteine desulfurase